MEDPHLTLSVQVTDGQAPTLALWTGLSPRLANKMPEIPRPQGMIPPSAPDFRHFSVGPTKKGVLPLACELMDASWRPPGSPSCLLRGVWLRTMQTRERAGLREGQSPDEIFRDPGFSRTCTEKSLLLS